MRKVFISVFITVLTFFFFSGCYDAIFQEIRTEVELNEGSISGFINNIVRFSAAGSGREFLIISDGNLYIKEASSASAGNWIKLSGFGLPEPVSYSYYDGTFSGEHIFKVAADKDHLYALSYAPYYNQDKSRNVPKDLYLYECTPKAGAYGLPDFSSGWHRVDAVNSKIKEYVSLLNTDYFSMDASVHLFCTNAYNPEHRKAYIRVGGSSPYDYNIINNYFWVVYELNGGSPEVINCSDKSNVSYNTSKKDYFVGKDVLGAFYFKDSVHFTNTLNPTTNESKSRPDATFAYLAYDTEYLSSFSLDDYNAASSNAKGKVLVHTNSDGSQVFYEGKYSLIKAYLAGVYATRKYTDEGGVEKETSLEGVARPDAVTRTYMNTDSTICSLAVCADSLLMGTGSYRSSGDGIYRVSLDANGKPALITSSFVTNAADVMCKPYIVRSLLSVEPDVTELKNTIYASMDYIYTESAAGTSIENRGMWAYYPATLEWNRD